MWCGESLSAAFAPSDFPTLTVELDYLHGIARLDNAMPVRLTINSDGIEVKETMPGTRLYQIAAAAILEVRVNTRIEKIKVEKKTSLLKKYLLHSAENQARPFTEVIHRDYLLTIQYRADGQTCAATFHRETAAGKALIHKVAKALNSLVKAQAAQAK